MTKRGRRRSSRRRRSSSSSKQSVSAYIVQKHNKSNSVSYKDDLVEKGETDCLRKETVLSGSENEETFSDSAPKEKKYKHDYHLNSSPNQMRVCHQTAADRETGVKIVTSVSIGDQITVQQSHEPLSEDPPSAAPGANVLKIYCTGSNVKLEIWEIVHANAAGIKTTVVYMNEKEKEAGTHLRAGCEKTWKPNNESFEQPSHSVTRFSRESMREPTETHSPTRGRDDPNHCGCCCADCQSGGHTWSQPGLLNVQHQRKRFHRSFSVDQCLDVPPPQEFADPPSEDLSLNLASWRRSSKKEAADALDAVEKADLEPYFDLWSEPDNYEPVFMRASSWTNRSSFTKDFINCQKRKSWIRNNSIATIEQRTYPSHKKRRQTFPGMSDGLGSMPDDLIGPYSESFSSLMLLSLHLQAERLDRTQQANAFGSGTSEMPSRRELGLLHKAANSPDDVFAGGQRCPQSSITYSPSDLRQQYRNLKLQSVSKDMDTLAADNCEREANQSETADSGFHQEMRDVDYQSPEPFTPHSALQALSIQIIPPSRSGSEEQIEESPVTLYQNESENAANKDCVSTAAAHGKSSAGMISELQQRFTQMDPLGKHSAALQGHCKDLHPFKTTELQEVEKPEDGTRLHLEAGGGAADSDGPGPASGSTGPDMQAEGQLRTTAERHGASGHSETKEHLRPVIRKEPDNRQNDSDRWGKRRKLFKETKQSSSAAGSSVTSDVTEESVSEDSLDATFRDHSDRGFYTETFHSSAWMYQGEDAGSGPVAASLNARPRAASIRERTVKISKGSGEYPWGFRIQFSKPIVVTEVDTNGAAEEAGLVVGDYVLAVNGTDVTSVPHSEAAALARQGPDVLTLTVGSDIACCPNTPRPACRGYLHKRTQTGLIKGWRKRWFVLTHDRCLYYYRHKRDEGRRRAVSAVRLEGAEVGQDSSLGKPFVFKCRPQAADRLFFFCATSNQEMKRWLEAMRKATHPVTQNHVWVDVTRHNSNLPPLAVKHPECLGLLHMMDKGKDAWLQHYCILMDGCLYLYSGIRATHAHGGIYLQGYVVREQPYGSKKSTIELKPPSEEFKTFYLCAENPNENQRWIVALKASIKKWLPLHQALQDFMNRPPEETRM